MPLFYGDYMMTVCGSFVVSGPMSDESVSKSRLMGPVWWKKCSEKILLLLLKFDEMIFLAAVF